MHLPDMCLFLFQVRYRLPPGADDGEEYTRANRVIDRMATKLVKEALRLARVDAVMKHCRKRGRKMTKKAAAREYLTAKQYLPWRPEWMDGDHRAWKHLCRLWASEEWIDMSRRNRGNRDAGAGLCNTYMGGLGMGHVARDLVSTLVF